MGPAGAPGFPGSPGAKVFTEHIIQETFAVEELVY